jgi:hypothetical protein
MQTSNLAKLLNKRIYYEDPRVEMYSKKEGVIKKKKESTMIVGTNPGSLKKYFKFHKKGRVLAYYDDCPPKSDSRPRQVFFIQEIKELLEAPGGKSDHFKLSLHDEIIELKLDEHNEVSEWIKAIGFFREYYAKEKPLRTKSSRQDVDFEMQLQLMSENELSQWDSIKQMYDYSTFFRDKSLLTIFMQYPAPMLSNRLLISKIKKNTKWNKDVKDNKEGAENKKTVASSSISSKKNDSVSNSLESPLSLKGVTSKIGLFDRFETVNSKAYTAFLISQRPVSDIDEEQALKDHKAITQDGFPPEIAFNTIYLYEYSGTGDVKPVHKKLSLK